MTDLFEFADQGAQLRDAGMKLALDAQDARAPEWSDLAYAAIKRIAQRQGEVHVDDVLKEFTLAPDHPNAWGGVWMRLIRDNVLERTGRVRPCTVDAKKHHHQYPLYRSNLFTRSPHGDAAGPAAPSEMDAPSEHRSGAATVGPTRALSSISSEKETA